MDNDFTTKQNRLLDFLTLPRYRAGRHALIIMAFVLISVGQSLFSLGDRAETLGNKFYLLWLVNAIVLVALCYLNFYGLTPHLLLKNRYAEYLFALFGGIFIYIVIKWITESYLLLQVGIVRNFNAVTLLDGLSILIMYAICLASSSAPILFRQWISDTEKINALESSHLQSSVDEIKSRLNTRVLFRVLDYAAEKVKTDPGKVSDLIFRLSEELRRELYEGKKGRSETQHL